MILEKFKRYFDQMTLPVDADFACFVPVPVQMYVTKDEVDPEVQS